MASGDNGVQLKLKIWAGSWDLPSVDPDCLNVITYAKFMKAPLILEETMPSKTLTGTLPELQIEESIYTSPLNIIAILRKEGYNADFNLNSIDHADILAYVAMVEEKLKPGLLQDFWADSGNYVNVTRPAFYKSFGFLRSYWDLPQMRNKIECDLYCRTPGTTSQRESHYYKEAKSCITLLSKKLGNKDFFFGSTPSTFDALVFSHLSVILKAPLVSTTLKNHLNSYDNLCKYCGRISQRYFKDGATSSYATEEAKTDKKHKTPEADLKQRRNKIISFAVAVIANIVFALGMKVFIPKSNRLQKAEFVEVDDILD